MRVATVLLVALLLPACSVFDGGEGPAPPTPERMKSECDQLAARAIETDDVAEARRLAAGATECYAAIEGQIGEDGALP